MSARKPVIGIYQAIIVVAAIFVWLGIAAGCQRCTDEGGQYVRGVVWFECVDPASS